MSNEINTLATEFQPFIKRSVTSAAGNLGGTTLVDATLVEANDFWNGMAVMLRTGDYAGPTSLRRVVDFDSATHTLTLDHTVGGQIAIAVQYVMFFPTIQPVQLTDPDLEADLGSFHNQFGWCKFLHYGLDRFFIGRQIENFGGYRELPITVSDYWRQVINDATGVGGMAGEIRSPANYVSTAVYSRRAWQYGHLVCHATMPDLTPIGIPNNSGLFFGFENDSIGGTGIASFYWVKLGGLEFMVCIIGSGTWAGIGDTPWNWIDVTALMPANIKTALHIWEVELTENLVGFYLDGNPVAYSTLNNGGSEFTAILGPPYSIGSCNRPIAAALPSLLELYGQGVELTANVSPYGWRLSEGSPRPPRVVRMYRWQNANRLAGTVIAAGNQMSHPIPTYGFPNKTLHFQCNQAFTVTLEALMHTDNWRIYDTFNVAANTLKSYVMEGQATLLRATISPAAFPCTVNDAEAVLA